MAKFSSVTFQFCCVFQILSIVFGMPFTLDVGSDVVGMWKISDDAIYVETGKGLRQAVINQYLPDNFKYSHFALTQGIWAVVPDKNKACAVFGNSVSSEDWMNWDSEEKHDSNGTSLATHTTEESPCDVSSSASFQCILSAQLLSSVAVRYNFGGNASIRITSGSRKPFEIFANNFPSNDWSNLKVKTLEGSMMLLEAIVNKTGDYVLIDKITVESLEPEPTPTTPTKRPRTKTPDPKPSPPHSSSTTAATTEKPAPAPTSGQNGIFPNGFSNMIMIIFSYFATVRIIQYL